MVRKVVSEFLHLPLEADHIDSCARLLQEHGDRIRVPSDITGLGPAGEVRQLGTDVPGGWKGLDIGPGTAAELHADPHDPRQNVEAGAMYLRELLLKYDDTVSKALAAYNAGPDRVEQYGRVPPFTETLSYVRRVKRSYDKSKSKASAKTPASPGAIAATSRPRQSQ